MGDKGQEMRKAPRSSPPSSPPLAPAPALMMIFWMLLGGAAGIKLAQSVGQLLGWDTGEISIAVPAGGVIGRPNFFANVTNNQKRVEPVFGNGQPAESSGGEFSRSLSCTPRGANGNTPRHCWRSWRRGGGRPFRAINRF
jgi:hypothetical protein